MSHKSGLLQSNAFSTMTTLTEADVKKAVLAQLKFIELTGKPIFRTNHFVRNSGIPESTARRMLHLFKERGLLKELIPGRGRRSSILAFPELLNIAEGRKVF